MGSNHSVAVATSEQLIQSSMKAVSESIQDCGTSVVDLNRISFKNCTVEMNDIKQSNLSTITTECTQLTNITTDMADKIKTETETEADAQLSGLNIGLNSTEAENYQQLTQQLSQEIINTFNQKCATDAFQANIVDCEDSTLWLGDVSQENVSDVFSQCIQDSTAVQALSQEIDNSLQQTASSTIEGLDWTWLILIILILLALCYGFAKSGTQLLSSGWFWIGIISLFALIIVFIAVTGKKETDTEGE